MRFSLREAQEQVESTILNLRPNQELALHSRVIKGKEEFHIPMLDLINEFESSIVERVNILFKEFNIPGFAVYATGRSAHIYGLGLIHSDELVKFFGRALLLNLPDQNAIVDSRWIGHRLYAGFGSLRWSKNTPQYFQYPKEIVRYHLN